MGLTFAPLRCKVSCQSVHLNLNIAVYAWSTECPNGYRCVLRMQRVYLHDAGSGCVRVFGAALRELVQSGQIRAMRNPAKISLHHIRHHHAPGMKSKPCRGIAAIKPRRQPKSAILVQQGQQGGCRRRVGTAWCLHACECAMGVQSLCLTGQGQCSEYLAKYVLAAQRRLRKAAPYIFELRLHQS